MRAFLALSRSDERIRWCRERFEDWAFLCFSWPENEKPSVISGIQPPRKFVGRVVVKTPEDFMMIFDMADAPGKKVLAVYPATVGMMEGADFGALRWYVERHWSLTKKMLKCPRRHDGTLRVARQIKKEEWYHVI